MHYRPGAHRRKNVVFTNYVYGKEGRSDPGCRSSLRARRASTPTGSPTPRSGCSSVQNVDRVSRAKGIYRYSILFLVSEDVFFFISGSKCSVLSLKYNLLL
jgi:hypothetical protein